MEDTGEPVVGVIAEAWLPRELTATEADWETDSVEPAVVLSFDSAMKVAEMVWLAVTSVNV